MRYQLNLNAGQAKKEGPDGTVLFFPCTYEAPGSNPVTRDGKTVFACPCGFESEFMAITVLHGVSR